MSSNPIKKQTHGYNPIEEKRRTARINSLQKENEGLRQQLEKSRYISDAAQRDSKAWKACSEYNAKERHKLEEENQHLKLKLLQANIRMERAKSYLSGNFPKTEDLSHDKDNINQRENSTAEGSKTVERERDQKNEAQT